MHQPGFHISLEALASDKHVEVLTTKMGLKTTMLDEIT